MTLVDKITQDLTLSLKSKDVLRTSCLRMLKAAMKNESVSRRRELTDEEVQALIASQVRKGKEAAAEFRNGNREDLAQKEEAEIELLMAYLPQQLSADEVKQVVQEVIDEVSAQSPKDLGKVMKAAMARMAGRAEGKEVNRIARELLR